MSLASEKPQSGAQPTGDRNLSVASVQDDESAASGDTTPRIEDLQVDGDSKDAKNKKRSLFGFGKKRDSSKDKSSEPATAATSSLPKGATKESSGSRSTASPVQGDQPFVMPASPGRGLSSSPRLSSPARSQIFERDVDTVPALKPQSPAIPSHIQTENHIPPVLDASSEAITDDHLDPDAVEIVTHAQHQPASATVPSGSPAATTQPSMEQLTASWTEELGRFAGAERDHDGGSLYGSGDNPDIRRLSFISFADVVQSEHAGGPTGSRDSMHLAGLTSLSANRSPSPIRSPVSSQGAPGTSPPTSNPGSVKGVEMSPKRVARGGAVSPISSSHHTTSGTGEVNIETMSQALRRTGSKDLSGVRSSGPTSPVEGPSR